MNFAQQQRSPSRHLVGIAAVILFHVILIYALMNGLAVKMVEIIQKPLETKIIQEVKTTPPPPPEVKIAPPPKFDVPPPPFVPPPEVQVQAAPAQSNVMMTTTNTPPPADASVVRAAPALAPSPAAVARVDLICSNYAAVQEEAGRRYFKALDRDSSLKGDVQIELTVAENGGVKDVLVKKSASPALTRIVMAAVEQLKCNSQAREMRAATAFVFNQ